MFFYIKNVKNAIFRYFFAKNLHNSKKNSTFAPFLLKGQDVTGKY